jgi:PAS domain S-box-containing protein
MNTFWQKKRAILYRWLLQPHPLVQDASQVHFARLLAGLLLVSSVSAFLRVVYTARFGGNMAAGLLTVGGCLLAYAFSRSPYYRWSATLTLLLLAALVFINVLDGPGFSEMAVHASLPWLLLSIIFGSIFLSMGRMVILVAVSLAAIGSLPLLNPAISFSSLLGPIGLIATASSLLLVMRRHLARQEMERQHLLEQRDARYRALFERTNDAVFILDMNGLHTEVNVQAAALLGYTVDEMVGMATQQVVVPAEQDDSQAKKAALLRGEVLPIYERTFRHKDGHDVPVEVSVAIVHDANGRPLHIQSIARGIAERKRAQRERERLIEQLEAKNAELERFTYTVSHDLKSPLVTMQGFLSFLEKDLAAGKMEQVQRDAQRIRSAIEKMRHLLDDLLALSRAGRQMGAPETVSLGKVVQDAIELVSGRLDERGVTITIVDDLPEVWGDRSRLLQVCQNLLDNAIKFMGQQPHPQITIGCGPHAGDKLVQIYIQDNGMGIAPENQPTIFGLFNKLDTHSEGSGIGLALVQRIIEAHGGRVNVYSDGLGNGSTFTFSLPTPPQ